MLSNLKLFDSFISPLNLWLIILIISVLTLIKQCYFCSDFIVWFYFIQHIQRFYDTCFVGCIFKPKSKMFKLHALNQAAVKKAGIFMGESYM